MEGSAESLVHAPKAASVKALLESSGSTSIPSTYSYSTLHLYEPNTASEPEETIPIIDFSLLTSCDPHQRSKAIHQLSKACEEWGFFTLVNHGVPKSLMKAVIEGCFEFFNMTLEEKQEFSSNDMWSPIRFGTSIDVKVDQKICLWRDFLKVFVHPHFNFPNKPKGFSEVAREYSTQIRELVLELLKGISEGLGLEECYIEKAMDLERGFQLFAVNFYPRCPQPELAMGIPPHTDYGLLTCLISNGVDGLQIQRDGKWHNVKSIPDSILINVADQLEILSNGRCRSDRHRAVVNNNATRISIAMAHGPSIDKVVGPAPELVDMESLPTAFVPMEFKKYVELNHANPIDAPPYFEQLRPENAN